MVGLIELGGVGRVRVVFGMGFGALVPRRLVKASGCCGFLSRSFIVGFVFVVVGWEVAWLVIVVAS